MMMFENHWPKGSNPKFDSVGFPNLFPTTSALPKAEGKGIPERGHSMCKGRRLGVHTVCFPNVEKVGLTDPGL